MTSPIPALSAPALDTLPAGANRSLSGDVQVTCLTTGFFGGGDPADCTTHRHEHAGTVLVRADHLIYNSNGEGLVSSFAGDVIGRDNVTEGMAVSYTFTGALPGNVLRMVVTVLV